MKLVPLLTALNGNPSLEIYWAESIKASDVHCKINQKKVGG